MPRSLSASARAWEARGERVLVGEHRLFVVDAPAHRSGETPIVFLHGFPTSSFDWRRCVDELCADRRALAFDFLGFGQSDKPPGHRYSLFEQADLATMLLVERGIARAHLCAHDMGTSVATELLARRERGLLPFEIASVTFTNGSVYIEMAHLTPSQRLLRVPGVGRVFARASSYPVFRAQLRRIVGRPLPEEELSDMFALIERGDGKRALAELIGYVGERRRYGARWIEPLRRLDLPVLVAWGPRDPVAVMAIGERLAREIPGARLVRLEGIGHFPPLEAPELLCPEIRRHLAASGC